RRARSEEHLDLPHPMAPRIGWFRNLDRPGGTEERRQAVRHHVIECGLVEWTLDCPCRGRERLLETGQRSDKRLFVEARHVTANRIRGPLVFRADRGAAGGSNGKRTKDQGSDGQEECK